MAALSHGSLAADWEIVQIENELAGSLPLPVRGSMACVQSFAIILGALNSSPHAILLSH